MAKRPQRLALHHRGGPGVHLLPMTLLLLASSALLFWGLFRIFTFDELNAAQVHHSGRRTVTDPRPPFVPSEAKHRPSKSWNHLLETDQLQCGIYYEVVKKKNGDKVAYKILKCLQPQPGVPFVHGTTTHRVPLLLGVGPAKTGSSFLFSSLGRHPNIAMGNAAIANHDCCESELYFFTSRFDYHDPATNLSRYFLGVGGVSDTSSGGVKWLAEKTPVYHHDLLAPYKVKATIRPDNLALVFTMREPIEAHVSLFFHRMWEESMFEDWSANRTGYLQWTDRLLEFYEFYESCALQTLGAAFTYKKNGDDDLSWVGVQAIDEALYYKCLQPSGVYQPFNLEGIASLLYAQTLLRWRRVFPNVRATCVFHRDLLKNGEKEVDRVLTMLGLSRKMTNSDKKRISAPPLPPLEVEGMPSPLVGEARLLAMKEQGENPDATVEAVQQRLNMFKELFQGHWDFALETCSRLNKYDGSSLM